MSGTSVDGIDAALLSLEGHSLETKFELIEFLTLPFSAKLRETILRNSNAETARLDEICRLNFLLGDALGEAALKVIQEAGAAEEEVDLVASHGQTIHHLPEPAGFFGKYIRSTMQIGEPAATAEKTGILTIADFRTADVAAGGSGAPLIPRVDEILFRDQSDAVVCLNIGGIANVTCLPPVTADEPLIAFDTGPGNMMVDLLVRRFSGEEHHFDESGSMARSGNLHPELFEKLMQHPYFKESPPKTTGREDFGIDYVNWIIENHRGLDWKDIIHTVSMVTVESVAAAVEDIIEPHHPISRIIVSGGGARNKFFMSQLDSRLEHIAIKKSDDYGIPSDAKEAIGFAILGNETLHGVASNVPEVTGAEHPAILGKICLP